MTAAGLRVGVDVGGTFTDVIAYDADRDTVTVGKRLTDAEPPRRTACSTAVAGVAGERVGGLERFAHGTTMGLNALLQRRGAVVGLLCTEGFRDVLEIRRGHPRGRVRPAAGRRHRRSCRAVAGSRCASGCGPTGRCTAAGRGRA